MYLSDYLTNRDLAIADRRDSLGDLERHFETAHFSTRTRDFLSVQQRLVVLRHAEVLLDFQSVTSKDTELESHRGLPFGGTHRGAAVALGLKVAAHYVRAHYPPPGTSNLFFDVLSETFVYALAHLLNFNGWPWWPDLVVSQNPLSGFDAPSGKVSTNSRSDSRLGISTPKSSRHHVTSK